MTPRAAFAEQVATCARLGSPFMARLMALFANRLTDDTIVGAHVLAWPGNPAPKADNVPLRLAGALHALVLSDQALSDVYPPNGVDDDRLWQAIETALADHEAHILHWLQSAPQTNEVRRAAAILPALAALAVQRPGPVALVELGTSAGLNLRADHFALSVPNGTLGRPDSQVQLAPDWVGGAPPMRLPEVTARLGVDLNPLDPQRHRLRLLAYLWPDQPERIARTQAAIEIAGHVPATLAAADAADWLPTALAALPGDVLPVVFHTIALQYFPASARAAVDAAIAAAPVPPARIAMEADGPDHAALTLAPWPDASALRLADVDFHGRWVRWHGV